MTREGPSRRRPESPVGSLVEQDALHPTPPRPVRAPLRGAVLTSINFFRTVRTCRSARSTVSLARAYRQRRSLLLGASRGLRRCHIHPRRVVSRSAGGPNRTRAATVTAAEAESSLVRSTAEPTIGDPGPLPRPLEQGTLRRSPLRNGDHHPTFRVDKRPTGPQPGEVRHNDHGRQHGQAPTHVAQHALSAGHQDVR